MQKVLFAGVVLSVWKLIRTERKLKQSREQAEALQDHVNFLKLERCTHIKRMNKERLSPWVQDLELERKLKGTS